MKAIVQHKFGSPDVLELQDIDKPAIEDDQVLIRVRATSVNPYDWHMMTGTPYIARISAGLLKPKQTTPGVDVAGKIESVGKNVTQFQPGDDVFGGSPGAFAEYSRAREEGIVLKPANLTYEQAAAVTLAGLTALQGLRDKGRIQPGHKVLINGASGGIGTFAVQIAKALGAEVTGVCSTRNMDMVRSIGADHVVDYTAEDFTGRGEHYDLFLDLVGNRSLSECGDVLTPDGIYVAVSGPKKNRLLGPLMRTLRLLLVSRFGSHKMVGMLTGRSQEDLLDLRDLLESGKVTPVIDRQYGLTEAAEAMRHQEQGHAQGKTVITV